MKDGRKIVKAAKMTLQSTNADKLVTQEASVHYKVGTKRFNYLNRLLKAKDRN